MTQTTAERQALVDRLAEIDAEELKALVEPMQAIEQGESEVEEAREALLVAEEVLEAAERKLVPPHFN